MRNIKEQEIGDEFMRGIFEVEYKEILKKVEELKKQ